MGITRAQIARQLLAEGGMPMKKIKGQDHMLAYITPNEANKLVRLGGQETMTPEGIPAYPEYDNYGYSSQQDFDQGNYAASSDPTVSGYDNKNLSDEDLKALSYAVKPTPKTLGQKIVDSIKQIGQYTPFGLVKSGLGNLFDRFGTFAQNMRGGLTQKQFDDARRERQRQNRISNIMGRSAPFTLQTLENLAKLGYTGPLDKSLIGTTNVTRSGTSDQNFPDRVEGILSQVPEKEEPTFRDAMAQLNLEKGVPRDQVFLRAEDFIDPSKTISSEDLGTVQQNIKDATGYDTTLARNYTKQDLEKLGAGTGFFGANDQLKALQDYYDAATKYSQSGLGQTRSPSEIRDYIDRAGGVIGLGVPNIDMDLVPKDFLETEQDFKQQKSPIELLDI